MTATAASSVASAAPTASRHRLLRALQVHYAGAMIGSNVAGGGIVFLLLGFVLPREQRLFIANVLALVAYGVLSVVVGTLWSRRMFAPILGWLTEQRPVSAADRIYVVRHPLRQALINFAMWLGAVAVFVPINAPYGAHNTSEVAETIFMGGVTTCGLTYLLAERILRPINALAFEGELPTDRAVPGVKSRLLLSWVIGSGIPLLGIVMMATDHRDRVSLPGLAFLGVVGLVTGAVAMLFAARSVADPVTSVTSALQAVEQGRLNVRVQVYDGSQIGQLQNGFNSMVEGLRERQRLQDLFGRQVGVDVVRQTLERGARLGGEQVNAAMLFVDVVGSTELADSCPPDEVVTALNAFFAIVVDVVDRAGGFVNKFEGDAALCVFGAPEPRDDAATCALLAARLLHQRLADVEGLSAAIGVSAGPVVAGNIGARERYEYTVIGDAVNEAARLTELAKQRPDRLLVAAAAVEAAHEAELEHWRLDGEVTLRGRSRPTRLAVLAGATSTR
ncbi:MAG TPA: adenylate/guanylate cyclase domain-containing protein [Mycobacteriales bacterium]|nr:adenylate/guanylate cyclase domain-containing protein [Mycobacteriales bacterium]